MEATGADVFVLRLDAGNAEGSASALRWATLPGNLWSHSKQWFAGGGACEIAVDPAHDLPDAVKLLSTAEIAQSRSMVVLEDRRTYLFAHAFLRLLLSARLNRPSSALHFRLGAFGKPSLCEPLSDLHFSLSYRRNLIALALADDAVGIDIEEMRPDVDSEGIAGRMFLLSEQEHLQRLPESSRRSEFFRLWARKEALVKAAGVGLSGSSKADSLNDVQQIQDDRGLVREFGVKSLPAPLGYALALAWAV